jgi:hypothetical protein
VDGAVIKLLTWVRSFVSSSAFIHRAGLAQQLAYASLDATLGAKGRALQFLAAQVSD